MSGAPPSVSSFWMLVLLTLFVFGAAVLERGTFAEQSTPSA
jgi:hypothetical protein